ncbi:B- and T-lymphocyte attenuator-like [Onychostoma macrolepis]|uniref:Ig-like domain-containing protein n=1 Tax=Onychostoma macrolepis TaxID=369639 RepID=A0A7J6CQX4_9TELE|nr:B- and T-lymphocyte attenuator-like [Onychostoma macrolepis]KAF4109364.1 hypothetical protein G5714_010437 [Onychostoma macrolepis]
MDSAYLRKTALILYMLVVFILHVSADTQGHAPKCPFLKVPRGTVHKVFTNQIFKISCNLTYCDDQTINVTWTKVTLDKWIPVSEADQMSTSQSYSPSGPKMSTSYLTFTNISKLHEGSYRCELKLPHLSVHSHHINVSVSDNILEDEKRDISDSSSGSYPWWLPYLFICLGAVILVLTVMLILILCINAFKSSRRKNTQRSQVQYTAASVMSSSRPSVLKRDEFICVQNSEETQQHSHNSKTCNLTLQPGQSTSHMSDCSDDPLSNRKDSRSSQVVYASLHHLAPTPSSSTSRQTQEEFSEYASIRVS